MNIKESKEKILFDLVDNFDEDNNYGLGIGVHITDKMYPDFSYRIYHKDGYCFDVKKEVICEPNEIDNFDVYNLQKDGCLYEFTSDYDDFKTLNIDKAIELMNETVQK